MLSVSSGDYVVLCEDDGLPELYDYYRQNAVLVEEFDLDNPDCSVCFVGLQRDSETPFLVLTQSYSPSEFGFDPGVQLIEETGVLFVGAGERLLAYDLERATRLWEDEADEGFHRWSRHDSTVLMSAELELAAWSLEGRKLWSTFVEPPWKYTVEGGTVELDVMGNTTSFDLVQGPRSVLAKIEPCGRKC